jgi:quercetin dioxygenase-like cupin family protein
MGTGQKSAPFLTQVLDSPLGVSEMRGISLETNKSGAVHVPPGEGKKLWVAEELMTFVISSENTGGKYALTDSTVPPRGEAPPDIHHREDEAFWVIEGSSKLCSARTRSQQAPGLLFTCPEASSTPTKTSMWRPPNF